MSLSSRLNGIAGWRRRYCGFAFAGRSRISFSPSPPEDVGLSLIHILYLNEARNRQEKEDLAMIIEETLLQRYQGVKNEEGVWVTPAFPKLIYVLEEDNLTEGTPYFYLTKLAAKCTAKRMVPDYISEKIMMESKVDKNGEGHCLSLIHISR